MLDLIIINMLILCGMVDRIVVAFYAMCILLFRLF